MNEYSNLKVGDEMPLGKITRILNTGTNYFFYEANNSGKVAYSVKGFPSDWKTPLNTLLADIYALLPKAKDKRRYSGRIAGAFVDCLFGNTDEAIKLLEKILQLIKHSHKLRAKLCYIVSALIIVLINIILLFHVNVVFKTKLPELFILLFNIATFGSFGGFLSISFNFKKIANEYEENLYIPIITGISRIIISMISSVIVFAIIKSEIVLGVMNKVESNYLYYALGALSGFSEGFVPNILKSIEKDKVKPDTNN